MTDEVVFKDFSKQRKRVVFRLGGQEFEALPALPVPVTQRLVQTAQSLKGSEADEKALDAVMGIFGEILRPESAARFSALLNNPDTDAEIVDLTDAMDVMTWLMEVFGKRPTLESSDSSNGLPTGTDGTISTAGVPSIA